MSRLDPRNWINRPRVHRTPDGVVFGITDSERQLFEAMFPQLREMLLGVSPTGRTEEGLERLFPTAHPDDPELDLEYQQSSRDRLLAARLDRLDTVEASLWSELLSFDEHEAWMMSMNDLRLLIATRLDIGEDDDLVDLESADPLFVIYHQLGYVLGELIEASQHS